MTAKSLLRLRGRLLRSGIAIKSVDVGERLHQPKDHTCGCGSTKAKFASGKRGDRWVCAGHQCGRPWPMEIKYQGASKSPRRHAPGQAQLDRITDLVWAVRALPERIQRVLLLWDDTRRVPARARHRQYDLAGPLRRVPRKILEDYDAGCQELDQILRERGEQDRWLMS